MRHERQSRVAAHQPGVHQGLPLYARQEGLDGKWLPYGG